MDLFTILSYRNACFCAFCMYTHALVRCLTNACMQQSCRDSIKASLCHACQSAMTLMQLLTEQVCASVACPAALGPSQASKHMSCSMQLLLLAFL